MTSWVIADASLLFSLVFAEPLRPTAKALWQSWEMGNIAVAAPVLTRYEIAATLRKRLYRGLATVQEVLEARGILLDLPIQYIISDTLLNRAFDIATELNLPTAYDAQYLALAEHLACEFWTVDERLVNSVSKQLDWVKWVGSFPTPETP